MLENLINIEYCYNYLVNQIPVGLLLYAHLPAAILSLVFATYLIYKKVSLETLTLFVVCTSFSLWCFFNLSAWFAFLGSSITMFTWSLIDLFALLFFFFSYYFLYVFTTKKDLPGWQKVFGILIMLPTFVWTFMGLNLTSFNGNVCEAIESESITIYPYYVQAIFLVAVIVLALVRTAGEKNKDIRKKNILASTGVTIFLLFFFSSTLLVNILVNNDVLSEYAYNYEIYGLFGMPLLLGFLGYLVVRYKAFDMKVIGAQALTLALVAAIGSQFFFIQSNTNRILTATTLIITGLVGLNLVRSVKKEVEQREHIEMLAKDLEVANLKLKELDSLKSEFLSLATHQIRAPLTAIKGYSSMLSEGDFGILPKKAVEASTTIMKSCQNLINIVGDFLDISRIEQGRMVYNKSVFEIGELIEEVISEIRPNIDKAGLFLSVDIPPEKIMIEADRGKIKQSIGNIIDNAIKYTPKGSIRVVVSKLKNGVRLTIKDSGVGIDPKELEKLFIKFSRTSDANKTNVSGTGLGLYIAKKMIEASGGDIRVSSEGVGEGTTFVIELPEYKTK